MKHISILIIFLFFLSSSVFAGGDHYLKGKQLYNSGEFEQATQELEKSIMEKEHLTERESVRCRRMLVYSFVALGKPDEALSHARALLKLDSKYDFRADSEYSPKVEDVFSKAGAISSKISTRERQFRNEKIAGWSLLATSGGAAIGGVVTYMLALNSKKLMQNAKNNGDESGRKAYTHDLEANQTIMFSMFGLSIASAGTGIGLLFHSYKIKPSGHSEMRIEPMLTYDDKGKPVHWGISFGYYH